MGLSIILLAGVMLVDFIFHFMLSNKYKRTHYVEPVFKTMIYAMPLGCAVLFAVLPLAERFSGQDRNMLVIIGIIMTKTLIEFILVHAVQLFNTKPRLD